MRVVPTMRVVAALAAAVVVVAVVLASPASADTAEFTAVGTVTIDAGPTQVIMVGSGEPHPCSDPEDGFTVTTTGDASTGEVDISLPPWFRPKPGAVVDDEHRTSVLFDDLVYDRVGTTDDYDVTGTVVLGLDIWNQEDCEKTDLKCSFVMQLDVAGSTLHNGQALPTIGATATVDLVAITIFPLTYVTGDCDEYITLDGANVDFDLALTRT
jgi:hypothetical protein